VYQFRFTWLQGWDYYLKLHSEEEMIREKIRFLDLMLAKRDYNP